ncbi:MAG: hypothetical protein J0I41_10305 [Filimonas sp.]|nr:hypothetical protein [Filimonas sp.]
MRQFTVDEDGIKLIRKKTLLKSIPIVTLAVVVGAYLSLQNNEQSANQNFVYIFTPFIILACGFGIKRGLKRLVTQTKSLVISITGNAITREISNTPTITLYVYNIKEIAKSPDGEILIQGSNKNEAINIPAEIANYNELEALLNGIKPIRNAPTSFYQKYRVIVSLITLMAMIVLYTTQNHIYLILSCLTVVSVLVQGLYSIQTNRNIDEKTKRNSWISLFVIIAVIYFTILKLTGQV